MDEERPVIAEVVRDGFAESTHTGRVIGLAADGGVAFAIGAVDEPVLLRSCAKPLQAVAMVRAGLDVDGALLAIAAASHDGTTRHLDLVRRMLADVGLDEALLDNTPALPLEPRAAAEQLLAGGPTRLHQNCSGKHAAMLRTCAAAGWPTAGYLELDHPLQQAVLDTVADLAGEPVAHVATDGCGAPIAAVSLTGLARAFARLATGPAGSAEARVAAAMRAHPEVVGGDAREVTRLMRAVPGLVAKDGAEGCYAAAHDDGRAVAVKVDDGSMRACAPVAVAGLRALGVDGGGGFDELAEVAVLGHGLPVGALRARGLP